MMETCGIADILSHVMERYFTQTENVRLSDRISETVMRTVVDSAPKVMQTVDDYEARAELMWAGTTLNMSYRLSMMLLMLPIRKMRPLWKASGV